MTQIESHTIKPEFSFLENEQQHQIFTSVEESLVDTKISDLENFMKNTYGQKKSESEKDTLYKEAQGLWHTLANTLKEAKYNFHLNRVHHKFLTDLILLKLEYDVNTVFFAIELTNMLGTMKDMKFVNDSDYVAFPVNATEITYIYHLISNHKVKGLTKDAYTFSKILIRIGEISKVFNYYETTIKNLSKEIQDWIVTFDEGVSLENVPANLLEPQK